MAAGRLSVLQTDGFGMATPLHRWVRPTVDLDRTDAVLALLVVVAVNAIGAAPAILGGPNSEWFASLEKPALFPPTWAFGVAWTLLFSLMGVAVYLVARNGLDRGSVRLALGLFGLQFAFNVAWTPVFFTLERPLAALGVIVVLDFLVTLTIFAFARIERVAATLLVPYLLWALFATVLNYQFWALNA